MLIKALQPGYFYAREDTRTPDRLSGIAVVINCATALSLLPYLGALHCRGRGDGRLISTVLLFTTLLRRGHLTWEWALARRTVLLLRGIGRHDRDDRVLQHRWAPASRRAHRSNKHVTLTALSRKTAQTPMPKKKSGAQRRATWKANHR